MTQIVVLRADEEGMRENGSVGKGESGNTEEGEKSRLKVTPEVSSMLKSDAWEKLGNIRVQSWEFFVEFDDSLFLPEIILFICLLLIDVTQVSVLSLAS